MSIGDRIKMRREQLDISVDDLAKIVNKNRATIYRYESGGIENLPTTILKPLADALQTTPSELMGWNNDYLGDYEENVEYLKDKPELLQKYEDILKNDRLRLLFDKAKKLEPQDLEQILKIIDTFDKRTM